MKGYAALIGGLLVACALHTTPDAALTTPGPQVTDPGAAVAFPDAAVASHEAIVVWDVNAQQDVPVATAGPYAGIAMGDLDGDQDLDLFFARYERHTNGVLLGDGVGGFVDSGQTLGHRDSWDVILGDFDQDGDLDALVANSSSSVNDTCDPDVLWHNDGQGRFVESGQTLHPGCTYAWLAGDLDRDGDLDAVSIQGTGAVVHLNADGVLQPGSGPLTNTSGKDRGGALGDVDGDGDIDLVVSSHGSISVWLNDGMGGFSRASSFGKENSFAVDLQDLDGDGDLDAFVANRAEPNRVWFNDGAGRFEDSGQRLGDGYSLDVALFDVDADGDHDVLVANRATADRVWLNGGDGSFVDSGRRLGDRKSRHIALDASRVPRRAP